jgi:hypothetical protein
VEQNCFPSSHITGAELRTVLRWSAIASLSQTPY